MPPVNQFVFQAAVQNFRQARQQAALQQVLARVTRKSNDLLSYEEVEKKLRLSTRRERGLQTIPVASIVGSVGRYADFTRTFLPRNPDDLQRWARVRTAYTEYAGGTGLPPIDVYQVGDVYFVLDGNHRVSVARQQGITFIEANVIQVQCPVPLTPDIRPDDLIVKAEYADFLAETCLHEHRPDVDLSLTVPGQCDKLWAQIQAQQELMEQQQRRNVPLPDAALAYAKARFDRPAIFGRKCPHVVDALRHEGDVCRDSQRYEEAIKKYREAVHKDPLDFASKHALAQVDRRHGDRETGRAELEKLASSEAVPRTWRDRANEALADADFVDGRFDAAAARYEALASRSLDEDSARTREVKELAARDTDARPSVQALLLGDQRRGPDIFVAGVALGVWSGRMPSALVQYLVGRNLVQRAFYHEGARRLALASALGPPTKRIAREALRQRAIAACATNDRRALDQVRADIESPQDPFADVGGRRDAVLRMIARCAK